MSFRTGVILGFLMIGAACAENGAGGAGSVTNLPEEVVAMVAPNQDLTTARILPEDGCYWYSHKGPVETTLLPLRNVAGRPICTRPQV